MHVQISAVHKNIIHFSCINAFSLRLASLTQISFPGQLSAIACLFKEHGSFWMVQYVSIVKSTALSLLANTATFVYLKLFSGAQHCKVNDFRSQCHWKSLYTNWTPEYYRVLTWSSSWYWSWYLSRAWPGNGRFALGSELPMYGSSVWRSYKQYVNGDSFKH